MARSDQCSPAGPPDSERPDDQTGPGAISVAEARHLVLARIAPLAPQRVAIGDAAGQVLAETAAGRRGGAAVRQFRDGWLRRQGY